MLRHRQRACELMLTQREMSFLVGLCCLTLGVAVHAPASARPVGPPYDGPLHARADERPGAHIGDGAASLALECTRRIAASLAGSLTTGGHLDGRRSPKAGLTEYLTKEWHPGPRDGFRVEKRGRQRVLFSYDVGGRTRMAVVVVRDRDPKTHLRGWGAEGVAWCDPSEFDPSVDALHNRQVWSDRKGNRVDTRRIVSWRGPAHCDWTAIQFLVLKAHRPGERQFLRDPEGILADYVTRPYDPGARLPADAKDSGYRRAGGALWLTATAAYFVTADKVELWPRTKERIGCA
jgi:hypothetical protein